MKPIIIANWKCNPESIDKAKDIFEKINDNANVVVCPPFTYIADLKGLDLGGQNCYAEEGAFTGEVSCKMLKDAGCKYVILGHSERRKIFNETDELINSKIKVALENGLIPIFCIGETEDQRKDIESILENQIKKGLEGVSGSIIIAYEPVWAIGTGNACEVEDAKQAKIIIQKFVPENTPIIYGGSVKGNNAKGYIEEAGFNGLLVGGASLDPEEFNKIIEQSI